MLQTEIRQARIDHGFSQAQLARLAGVPRERVRQLESGGNVTLETMQKILAQLPNLKSISIGTVDFQTRGASVAEIRDALATWLEAGRRLLTLLENVPAAPPDTGEGRVQPNAALTPELEQRLRRLEARYQKSAGDEP